MAAMVSVVIPTYNRAWLMPRAVRSVLDQSWRPLQIIVVNDGSRDNTKEVLAELEKEIRERGAEPCIVHQENGGVANAINTGLKRIRGEFFAVLGDDDLWYPDKLRLQMEEIERTGADAAGCLSLWTGRNGYGIYPGSRRFLPQGRDPEAYLSRKAYAHICSVVAKSSLLPVVGEFDPSVSPREDDEWLARLSHEASFCAVEEVLVRYDGKTSPTSLCRPDGEAEVQLPWKLQIALWKKIRDNCAHRPGWSERIWRKRLDVEVENAARERFEAGDLRSVEILLQTVREFADDSRALRKTERELRMRRRQKRMRRLLGKTEDSGRKATRTQEPAAAPPAPGEASTEAPEYQGERPLVSVVIPTCNRAWLLPRAVRSVLDQTWRPLQIVVVDDGSTDNTKEVLAELEQEIRERGAEPCVIHKENGGVASARNEGLKHVRGAYFCFLDDDDLWYPDKTARQMAEIQRSGAQAANCLSLLVEGVGYSVIPGENQQLVAGRNPGGFLTRQVCCHINSVLADSALIPVVGEFDGSISPREDSEWLVRLLHEADFCAVDDILVRYDARTSATSLCRPEGEEQVQLPEALQIPFLLKVREGCAHRGSWSNQAWTQRVAQDFRAFTKARLARGDVEGARQVWKQGMELTDQAKPLAGLEKRLRKAKPGVARKQTEAPRPSYKPGPCPVTLPPREPKLDAKGEDRPLVSVVIPTCNRADLLPRAVRSVIAQTWRPIQIIVVDDGSTDDTEDVLAKLEQEAQEKGCVATFVSQQNGGRGAARNAALRLVEGDYFAFLDDDDDWLPHKLEAQIARIKETGATACCGLVMREFPGGERPHPSAVGGQVLPRLCNPAAWLAGRTYAHLTSLLVDARLLPEIGEMDETLPVSQDDEWMARLMHVASFCAVEQILGRWRYTKVAASRTTGGDKVLERQKVFERVLNAYRERNSRHPNWNEEAWKSRVARDFVPYIEMLLYAGDLKTAREKFAWAMEVAGCRDPLPRLSRKLRKAGWLALVGRRLKHPKYARFEDIRGPFD